MLNDQLRAASVPVSELTGTPTGGGSRMTTEGAIRWLPIGIPLEPRPQEARIASLDRGQRWTGDRFIRCRLKGATPNTWQDGLPERECKILPRSAETARNAHVLREIEDNELPIVGRLMLVNDITDDPGRHALHGTPVRGNYETIGALKRYNHAGSDHWQPTRGEPYLVPIGAILASVTWCRTGPDPHRVRWSEWWRAWRIPPTGTPYLEWETIDPRLKRGWTPDEETPHEHLAQLLDADISSAFNKWLERLEAEKDLRSRLTNASARRGVALWDEAVRAGRANGSPKKRKRRR